MEKLSNPTPGELQEIKAKEAIIMAMQKKREPTKVASGRGYSIQIETSAEYFTIKGRMKRYKLMMDKHRRKYDETLMIGFKNYEKAVKKMEEREKTRQKFIDLAKDVIKKFTVYVEENISK